MPYTISNLQKPRPSLKQKKSFKIIGLIPFLKVLALVTLLKQGLLSKAQLRKNL